MGAFHAPDFHIRAALDGGLVDSVGVAGGGDMVVQGDVAQGARETDPGLGPAERAETAIGVDPGAAPERPASGAQGSGPRDRPRRRNGQSMVIRSMIDQPPWLQPASTSLGRRRRPGRLDRCPQQPASTSPARSARNHRPVQTNIKAERPGPPARRETIDHKRAVALVRGRLRIMADVISASRTQPWNRITVGRGTRILRPIDLHLRLQPRPALLHPVQSPRSFSSQAGQEQTGSADSRRITSVGLPLNSVTLGLVPMVTTGWRLSA